MLPLSARAPACSTRWAAPGMGMKYPSMLGDVKGHGPPCLICASNRGITLPWLPSTLPNRTATHFISV